MVFLKEKQIVGLLSSDNKFARIVTYDEWIDVFNVLDELWIIVAAKELEDGEKFVAFHGVKCTINE